MWFVIGALVLLAAAVAVGRRAARKGVDPTQVTLDPALVEEIRGLHAQNRKVQAIALLRQRTGVNLQSAVVIVDRLTRPSN